VLFTKYYWSNQVKNDKKGGTRSTHEGNEKYTQHFGRKPEGKRQFGDLGVDEMIEYKIILGKWDVKSWLGI
jgi:hypothetical protein